VNAEAELPDGERVDGMSDLKRYLLTKRKADFGRALAARMACYALGRSLELTDEDEIDRIAEDFASNDHRLRYLISRIARSELFQTK
jgi:hypothetical protein